MADAIPVGKGQNPAEGEKVIMVNGLQQVIRDPVVTEREHTVTIDGRKKTTKSVITNH